MRNVRLRVRKAAMPVIADAKPSANLIEEIDGAAQAALGWSETNSDFHRMIMKASGNSSLSRILKEVSVGYFQNIILTSAAEMTMHRMTNNIESHSRILSAIEDRDSGRARKAMTEHVLEGGAFVTAWFERRDLHQQ